ncbi:MAG TPA: glucose 1-dehydrogenase [Clostridia bacterium]
MKQFENRVAVVTGGGQGIGRGIAQAFAGAGARVVIGDIDDEAGREAAFDINRDGGHCFFLRMDVASWSDCRDLAAFAVAECGTIDVLVNNAGISKASVGSIFDETPEMFDRVMDVNLRGTFLCTKACIPFMTRSGGGSIVNIASTRAFMSEPETEAYSASKGGVISLTHALAISLAIRHIRVNSISPGWIDVSGMQKGHPTPDPLSESDHRQHPAGRVGEPADIAAACLYLCSADAGFITGMNLTVDGGMTVKMIYQ